MIHITPFFVAMNVFDPISWPPNLTTRLTFCVFNAPMSTHTAYIIKTQHTSLIFIKNMYLFKYNVFSDDDILNKHLQLFSKRISLLYNLLSYTTSNLCNIQQSISDIFFVFWLIPVLLFLMLQSRSFFTCTFNLVSWCTSFYFWNYCAFVAISLFLLACL